MAFDSSGNLWVANYGDNVSELGAPSYGIVKTIHGLSPFGVAFDHAGSLYVSNTQSSAGVANSGNITIFNATSLASRRPAITNTIGGLSSPQDIAFDPGGNLWVADSYTGNLTEYGAASLASSPTVVKTFNSKSLTTDLGTFQYLTFDQLGNLWADQGQTNPKASGPTAVLVQVSAPALLQASPTLTKSFNDDWIPGGLAFDSCGDLWVAGSGALLGGGGISEFNASSLQGRNPKVSFEIPTSASALTFDAGGDLWASQFTGKILEYSVSSLGGCNPGHGFENGQPANIVIGEPNFTSMAIDWGYSQGTNQKGLTTPTGIAFDSHGDLWVADSGNGRITKFEAPFVTAEGASIPVLGHPGRADFGLPVTRGVTNASTIGIPTGISEGIALQGLAFDQAGNLWVTDSANNRVLEFDAVSLQSAVANQEAIPASIVIGQPNFTSNSQGTSATQLSGPTGIAFDPSGNLWVSDTGNNRVVEFRPPFSVGQGASAVVGQPDFTSFTPDHPDTTLGGLDQPIGIAFDGGGNLWVADNQDHRVMMFEPPFVLGENSSLLIGEMLTGGQFVTIASGPGSVGTPVSVAFDQGGNLWVGQSANCKFTEFPFPLRAAENAITVIGQPDFQSNDATTTQAGLNNPTGVAFDSSGHLWIADTGNSRVLEYLKAGESNPWTTTSSISTTTGSTTQTGTTAQSTQPGQVAAPPASIYVGIAAGVSAVVGAVAYVYAKKIGRRG